MRARRTILARKAGAFIDVNVAVACEVRSRRVCALKHIALGGILADEVDVAAKSVPKSFKARTAIDCRRQRVVGNRVRAKTTIMARTAVTLVDVDVAVTT